MIISWSINSDYGATTTELEWDSLYPDIIKLNGYINIDKQDFLKNIVEIQRILGGDLI